jgi:hypothetical protein
LYRRRNIPVKEHILPSLQTVNTIVAKTKTTETTETLVAIEHTDNLIATADPEDTAMSVRKRIADHRSIQTRNRQEQKRPTKASSITVQTDASTIALKNSSNNMLLSTKKKVTKIQRQRQIMSLKA